MTTLRSTLEVDGGEMPLVTVEPPEGTAKCPALVVVPSIFGVADDLVGQMEEIAGSGALVLAVDPFFRVQPGPIPYEDMQAAMARVGKGDLRAGMADFRRTLEHARNHPRCNGRVAVLGICFGAIYCLSAASRGEADGVVTWHGSGMKDRLQHADKMACPMRLHFGGDDALVGQETIDAVTEAFADRDDVKIVVHAGADHGYSHAGGAYQEAAERASVAAAVELLGVLA